MSSAEQDSIIYELIARLCAIRDTRQRGFALATRLGELDDQLIAYVLKLIRERAQQGQEDFRLLYNGLMVSDVFADVLGAERLSALVGALRAQHEYEVVAMLMDVPPEGQDEIPFQPFLDVALKEIPLGTRKELARKPDFKLIKRIARDQDHRVISNLLDNPRLTEMDVVRIGATRPTSHKVLEAIYNHSRWISRYSVKKVIVLNPFAPLSMAVRLLTFMKLQDLEEVLQSPDLHPALLEEARRILEKKPALPEGEYTLDL